MKTSIIHVEGTLKAPPIYRFINLLIVQTLKNDARRFLIQLKNGEAQLFFDHVAGAPPPAHIIKYLHIPLMKYAGLIKWPWRKRIANKLFKIRYDGRVTMWSLSSNNLFEHLEIRRINN